MKKKKIIIYILIIVLIHIVSLICTFQAVYMSTKNAEESKALTFYLPESGSFASTWNYTMSEEGIIEKKNKVVICFYTTSTITLNLSLCKVVK